jgi:protein ImuB
LFGEQFGEEQTRELRWLLERLSSRLGADAVVRAISVPDAQPELAVAYQPWIGGEDFSERSWKGGLDSSAIEGGITALAALRPLRLFAPPRRVQVAVSEPWGMPSGFYWEQAERRVRQAWGPERIETGWWRGKPIRRDYFRVEIVSGERYWLFRAREVWFVHGVFE